MQSINRDLLKEGSFLKHVRKMAKEAQEDYKQELSPSFGLAKSRRGSISKSPDNSPLARSSVKGKWSPSRKSSSFSPGLRGYNFNIDILETSSVGKS